MDQSQSTGTSGGQKPDFKLHDGCLLTVRGSQIFSNYGKIPDGVPVMNWNDIGRYLDNELPEFRAIVSAVVLQLQGTGARSGP